MIIEAGIVKRAAVPRLGHADRPTLSCELKGCAEMLGTIGPNPKALLSVTGVIEASTGLALLVAPSLLVELLLGTAPGTPAGVTVTRVAGMAVLALGVACWLARDDAESRAAKGLVAAMFLYNVAVVAILIFAWASLGLSGVLSGPVVLAHIALAAWCIACLSTRTAEGKQF
jgi:hypothetical protein